jgi:hypothetical protein
MIKEEIALPVLHRAAPLKSGRVEVCYIFKMQVFDLLAAGGQAQTDNYRYVI